MLHSEGHPDSARLRRRIAGYSIFFPLATAYAIFVLPASVFAILGLTDAFPALASSTGHAHEMLFGFALAVVAGNQLGPMAIPRLVLLAGLWVIARAAFLCAPQSMTAAAANIAFVALLAMQLVPRLSSAAKKWRNQALPLVLVTICISGIAFQLARHAGFAGTEHAVPIMVVLLLALLMLFMGGRIIAATVAVQFYRQGGNLVARVQPRIEGGLIIAMVVAIVASLCDNRSPFALLAAAATIIAGALAAVRLLRWRLWGLRGRPDLLCLAAGYAWLAIGLMLYGAALAEGRYQLAALHIITVGALGTLTLNVMAMTWTLKARQDPSRARVRIGATILIGTAVLARELAALDPQPLLVIASMIWSSAFVLLLIFFVRLHSRAPAANPEPHCQTSSKDRSR
ncbi:NnrS family protein [Georgfuchsia toluolica]|uniref:NnrS family protein n=1 Tax=Georgfuchsia toluolica TaxID=424218 RepID=UPI001C731064|nr:NnrS family protein [Georgfuchsia toluolica]